MRTFEFWVRIIAWLCAVIFITSTIREIIDGSASFFRYSYWIFPIATLITGVFDLIRYYQEKISKEQT